MISKPYFTEKKRFVCLQELADQGYLQYGIKLHLIIGTEDQPVGIGFKENPGTLGGLGKVIVERSLQGVMSMRILG